MEILLFSIVFTLDLVFRMGSVMFISLFGVELFMQMGLMRHLKPVGKPISRGPTCLLNRHFVFWPQSAP